MKTIMSITIVFLTINTTFSQGKIGLHKKDGTVYMYISSGIDSITIDQFYPCPGISTVTYDGKIYNTELIGEQCWLRENLDIGTMINSSTQQTNNATTEKYCYGNDPDNCDIYGGLYRWNESMQYVTTEGAQGICPTGWHIPSQADFQTLLDEVGNDANSIKSTGQGSDPGTNYSGFSALLSGYIDDNSVFGQFGIVTGFWSSTEYSSPDAAHHLIVGNVTGLGQTYKDYGFSIRCIKD